MKYFLYFLLLTMLFVGANSVMAKSLEAKEIRVRVENIDVNKPGNIMVMLYGEEGFPKDHAKALSVQTLPANAEYFVISFSTVPAEFAIKVLHDEDCTGEVSKNWTGIIPSEGLGFSNDAKLSFGPPKFAKAKLTLSELDNLITIKMVYP